MAVVTCGFGIFFNRWKCLLLHHFKSEFACYVVGSWAEARILRIQGNFYVERKTRYVFMWMLWLRCII